MEMYGKEDPRVLVLNDIFNPTTALMELNTMLNYINALREDYKDSLAEEKEFNEKYGGFISPIEGATKEFYDESVGKVMNVYNQLAQNGIDPLRSVQGRSALRRAMYGVNYAKLANMKLSAENKQKYNEAILQLKLQNKWNPEVERQELQRLGIDPNNWDNSKVWTRLAPEVYTDQSTYFADLFKNLPTISKEIKDPKTGETIGRVNGVDENAIKNLIEVSYPSYANTASGRYEIENLKNRIKQLPEYQNASDDQLNKAVEETIKDNLFKLGNKSSDYKLDPLYEKKIDLRNRLTEIGAQGAQERANIKFSKDYQGKITMWDEIDNSPSHQVTINTSDIDRNNAEPVSKTLTPAPNRAGYVVHTNNDVYSSSTDKAINIGKYNNVEFRSNGTFTGTGKASDGYKEHGYLVGKTWIPGKGNKKGYYQETVLSNDAYVKVRRRKHNYGSNK